MVILKQECPICYDIKPCIKLNCGHNFCKECLRESLIHFDVMNDEFTCAMCRHEIKFFENEELNLELNKLHLRINLRKIEEDEYYLFGSTTWYLTYIIWFLSEKDIHNYPKNMKFYTYEEII